MSSPTIFTDGDTVWDGKVFRLVQAGGLDPQPPGFSGSVFVILSGMAGAVTEHFFHWIERLLHLPQ